MRVMLDTNIIISAALTLDGMAAKAFLKAMLLPYEPGICEYIVDELHRIFQQKFPKYTENLEVFLSQALTVIHVVPTPVSELTDEKMIRDVNDRPMLRAARYANVDILLTDDRDFLESEITHPRIINAPAFIEL